MSTIEVPYHLDERLPAFDADLPVDTQVTAALPDGDPWHRMAFLYEQVAAAVAEADSPLVVSGDCTTSLGVLAGLQRTGLRPGIVWLDAHADFHTEASTVSGYLGGLPLALAVGVGTPTLPRLLGLEPVAEERATLVDARDTDPGERVLLDHADVVRTTVGALGPVGIPDGDVYLHVDLDVCDPDQVPELLYPAPGGPAVDAVLDAVRRVVATGRVAAVGLACTWRQDTPAAGRHAELLRAFAAAASGA